MDVLRRQCTLGLLSRVFIWFLQVAVLGEVSIRIVADSPGVSFHRLMHHSECLVRFGVILWSASPLSLTCLAVIGFFVTYSPDIICSWVCWY